MEEERGGEMEEKMRGGRIETDSLMEVEMETGRKGTQVFIPRTETNRITVIWDPVKKKRTNYGRFMNR